MIRIIHCELFIMHNHIYVRPPCSKRIKSIAIALAAVMVGSASAVIFDVCSFSGQCCTQMPP